MRIKDKLLLTPKNFVPSFRTWKIDGVLNPAAVRMRNKKILLYVRVAESHADQNGFIRSPVIVSKEEYKTTTQKVRRKDVIERDDVYIFKDGTCRLPNISHFRKVILGKDGFKVERIGKTPHFVGHPDESEFGVEDPRIVKLGNMYYMAYVGASADEGISVYVAESKNLIRWKRIGMMFMEQNKDATLFPEKIKGKFVALHRPESAISFRRPGIWISYSKDLVYWGKNKSILQPRENSWEEVRMGAGAPPIRTSKGWLLIYHGVKKKKRGNVYSAGAALLDLENPQKLIARSPKNKPLIRPTKSYEKKGYINNVVFPTGAVPTLDKESLLIYSGGADKNISVREMNISDILKHMRVR